MILAAAAVVLPLGIAGGSALAYFTANTTAAGGYAVEVGMDTDIDEEFSNWTKHITIKNSPDGGAVYVRAKAFSGSQYSLTYPGTTGWYNGGDGYWYYADANGKPTPLEPGKTTSELLVQITNMPADEADQKEEFNVIVIYEQMPVKYNADGDPIVPTANDWEKYAVRKEEEGKLTEDPNDKTEPDGTGNAGTGTDGTGTGTDGTDTGNVGTGTDGTDTENAGTGTDGTDTGSTGTGTDGTGNTAGGEMPDTSAQ